MKFNTLYLAGLIMLLAIAGCSKPIRSTYELAVVTVPSDDSIHREVKLEFEVPFEVEVEVTSDGADTQSVTVDQLNLDGTFTVTLAVTRNSLSDDGEHTYTTLIRLESPTGASAGGPSTYTVDGEMSLDDVLTVTATEMAVQYGVPHMLGLLNGKPITLVVKPLIVSQ